MSLFTALGLPRPGSGPAPGAGTQLPSSVVQAGPVPPGTPGMSRRLREMAKWVWLAHKAWKKLSNTDRLQVLNQIGNNYGTKFADEFLKFTQGGAKPDNRDYVTSLPHQTPKWFEDRGYRLLSRSDKQQWWIHPSGQQIYLVMEAAPYVPSDLEKALKQIEEDHDKANALDAIAMRIADVLRQEPVLNWKTGLFDPPPPPSADPEVTFGEYLEALAAESTFLDGALADAAAMRAKLLKKKVKLDEFDAAVEEKLALLRRRIDLLMEDERLDDLDPSKQEAP